MSTYAGERTPTDRSSERTRYQPAYGPVDAALGFGLFYVLVDRATPVVVDVAREVPGIDPSLVRFGLAAALWFVLTVTVVDQLRRQLAALGVGTHDAVDPDPASRAPPTESVALAYLVLFVLGGGLAWLTVERALETAVALIPAVAALDAGAFVSVDFAVMVVFFLSFAVATRSLDRLVVGGIRWALQG